jgi:hypothetical protein
MKFESDTEIDRLLRRQARRKASSASSTAERALGANGDDEGRATNNVGGAAHLDADEMNAFAEGNLSEASRARYFTHLADCDECRGLVTKLTLAANVPIETGERTTAVAASERHSWRDWLSAFFAPPVLRYAIPALALLAVMVVAFVATRDRRQPDIVAQNEERQQNAATATATPAVNQDEPQSNTTTATTNTTVAPGAEAPLNANTNAKDDGQPEAVKNAAASTAQRKDADADSDVTTLRDEPKPTEKAATGGAFGTQARTNNEVVTVTQPPAPVTVAPATEAPVANSSSVEEAEAKSADASKKSKTSAPALGRSSSGIVLDGTTGENAESERRRAQQQQSGRREAPAARRSRPADTQSSREADGSDAKENRPAETRSAGGRQFRRQGGVWIDTAYSTLRSTVNVARGSEQYRSLVADEPGIRSITDQLGGTIIVVWKQRAYRIY